MVLRPDITAQDLTVGEAAAGMFIINAYNVLYSERVAASYNPVSTFFHTSEIIIPWITWKPDTKIRITAYIHNKGRHINHTAAFRGFIGVSSTSWTAWSCPTISEKHPNNPESWNSTSSFADTTSADRLWIWRTIKGWAANEVPILLCPLLFFIFIKKIIHCLAFLPGNLFPKSNHTIFLI